MYKAKRAEGVVQVVQYLPSNHKALSSSPNNTPHVHTHDSSTDNTHKKNVIGKINGK
jgi:hypothetical protein